MPIRLLGPIALLLTSFLGASCGGGGGGGNPTPPPPPPADSGSFPTTVSLISAAAGNQAVQLTWRAEDPDGNPVPVALFGAASPAAVYGGAPIAASPAGTSFTVSGLTNGQARYFGLALDLGGGSYQPSGEILYARPAAPFYVDASSTAGAAADGLTPATAYTTPLEGILLASTMGGGNVWIAGGDYTDVALPLFPGIDVYGGFDASLTLAGRDPAANPTRLAGSPGNTIVEVRNGGTGAALDGLSLDGAGVAKFGIDIDESPVELRNLEIADCSSHGIRARSASTTSVIDVCLIRCRVSANGAAGLSLDGAFDLGVQNSRFSTNRIEGLELGGLVSHEGQSVSLVVRDSVFFGNGNEGLDCDLVPPLVTGPAGADYTVLIERSVFERNGATGAPSSTSGMNVDIDFELIAGWKADITVRGCTALGNEGAGVRLDLDSSAETVVHRLHSTGNGGDGLVVSSESTPGLAVVSGSAFFGNQGYGVRVTGGNVPALVSHSVLAGNRLGGMASELVESLLVSSVGWLQANLTTGTRDHFNPVENDPLLAPFMRVPVAFQRVNSFINNGLQVEDATLLAVGDTVAVGGDEVERSITGFSSGHTVFVNPTPESVGIPTSFARFASVGPVALDLALSAGSAALGTAMPDPANGVLDAGVFGAALGGEVGIDELTPPALWFPVAVLPAPGTALASDDDLVVTFNAPLDGVTVNILTARVMGPGGLVANATASEQTGELVVSPPGGGWPTGNLVLQLHAGLASTAGDALPAQLALPFVAP